MTALLFPDACRQLDFGLADAAPAVEIIVVDPARLTVRQIIKATAARFGVTPLDIVSHRQDRVYAAPRQAAMLLARRHTRYPSTQIALHMNRDHSTVLYGVSAAESRMRHDPEYARKVNDIRNYLRRSGFEHIGDVSDRVVAKALEARRGRG